MSVGFDLVRIYHCYIRYEVLLVSILCESTTVISDTKFWTAGNILALLCKGSMHMSAYTVQLESEHLFKPEVVNRTHYNLEKI